jgi:hypothetical protein
VRHDRTFNRILLATEHSEFDAGSERVALAIARRDGLPVVALLPLLSNPEYEVAAPQWVLHQEAVAAARLDEMAATATAAGVPWHPVVRRGPRMFREVVDEAKDRATDLIIIRRRGRLGWLSNFFVGEMVAQVLTHAPCSVLVVPKQANAWSRHIVVAVDPTTSDTSAIEQAASLAADHGIPLTLLCVVDGTPGTGVKRTLAHGLALAQVLAPEARSELLRGKVTQTLHQAVTRLGADLVVVGRHGHGGITGTGLGDVMQQLIGQAECAVLVAADPTEAGRAKNAAAQTS